MGDDRPQARFEPSPEPERSLLMATESGETPILTLLAEMTEDSLQATSLDDQTVMLVRLAALVAVDAPAASYLLNMGAAGASGVDTEQVQGLLAAVAPIVGTPRVVAAAGNMVKAFDLKLELAELSGGQ
jgi:alkylhydroperoxidase/carboxymuconolactone decarboxylase family protein YurZ